MWIKEVKIFFPITQSCLSSNKSKCDIHLFNISGVFFLTVFFFQFVFCISCKFSDKALKQKLLFLNTHYKIIE